MPLNLGDLKGFWAVWRSVSAIWQLADPDCLISVYRNRTIPDGVR
jgi:hypothetical protein